MLVAPDPLVIQVILDGLGNILKMAGPQAKIICEAIETANGVEKIEALQSHENIEIYKLAYSLIENYFQGEVSCLSLSPSLSFSLSLSLPPSLPLYFSCS